MSPLFLYPRLPLQKARLHLQKIKGRSARELSKLDYRKCFADVIYPATGGTRVDAEVFGTLRKKLVRSAATLGFPERSRADPASFDPEFAAILYKHLPICPGEACREGFWSFVSICLLPDLVTWRFPDQKDERFLGGVRNTFQRLWWRAAVLTEPGAEDPLWLVRLPEDALVGLMERPGISSNRVVAMAIARAVSNLIQTLPASLKQEGWRTAYKRIRRRVPLVNLESLTEAAVAEQITGLCEGVVLEMTRQPGARQRRPQTAEA